MTKLFGKVDKSRIVQHLMDMRLDSLKRIYEDQIVSSVESEKRKIRRIETNNEAYLESLGEDLQILESTLIELSNLFCVALWSRIEASLNELGRHVNADWISVHDFRSIKKEFKDESIQLSKLPEYASVNVIREINNCVKHSKSIVTRKLQNVSQNSSIRFFYGERLELESNTVVTFIERSRVFLYSLIEEIKSMGKYE